MYLYWIISYIVGTFLTAWWVGKWKNTDLRQARSGNLGARNAGAVLGKSAFFLTFFGDALKGAIMIYIGIYYNFSFVIIGTGGLFVILGHLFPFWLKFKGGKGIATFIGVALAFNHLLFGIMAIFFIVLIGILRSATLSMVLAFLAYAFICWTNSAFYSAWPLTIAIIIILIRHRLDIKQSWDEIWWRR
ncbi:glycerol-3-phosphate acyltransferase [Psychrobacillus vulpis]|uniref:Glycerol-3-phosphate acyltransferase n=1 Tax=Psychrobacillus vulpis TaxID=2325572 RepID=A0A544TIA4_9BACI|nr:glycerol-3-phosphate acyltransferase [Psychrobacillus vulpis]TQR17183.1 glycerol-3-phosphate acyltransferase [Psychrobacillus vulpis]